MSNALAIAGVSAVLKDLLNNGLIDHDIGALVNAPVTVTALPPDRVKTDEQSEQPQLNLFLYQVTPNPGWSNVALPSRDDRGARLTNPPLAIDLHYLLTAYGHKDFDGEILLGYAMQLLHETPILTRDAIRTALATPSPVSMPNGLSALAATDLADQVEQIKIVPQNLNMEELSKLWTAFQGHYRPTAAYHVSVLLIESDRPTKTALPVRDRTITVSPFRFPHIEEIVSDLGPNLPILPNSTIVINGAQLQGDSTRVIIAGDEYTTDAEGITDEKIRIALPSNLRAGINSVQIVHKLMLGIPPAEHRGFESNIVAFVLVPTMTNISESATEFVIDVEPMLRKSQRVVLALNNKTTGTAYTFSIRPLAADSSQVTIPVSGLDPGEYFVRLQVDGAETSLLDLDPQSPTFKQFIPPQAEI
ncbi:MAG TPA: DUF4255 domain-containing protein [Chthoniobacterales bacterium]|jgi:hypothetical protein